MGKTQQQTPGCFLNPEPGLNISLALNPYYYFGKALLGASVTGKLRHRALTGLAQKPKRKEAEKPEHEPCRVSKLMKEQATLPNSGRALGVWMEPLMTTGLSP